MVARLFKIGLIGAFLAFILSTLNKLDLNKTVIRHEPGTCRLVDGVNSGSEDIALLSNGMAVVTSGGGRLIGSLGPHGNMFMVDLSNEDDGETPDPPAHPKAIKLKIVGHPDLDTFYPLGIAAWESETTDDVWLYVINSLKNVVEVYSLDVGAATAQYKKAIRDAHFHTMNNLVMTGPDSFYVTNFLHYTHPGLVVAEFALSLPFGTVVYYDGKAGQEMVVGLKGPNGIALSDDHQTLFLATIGTEELHAYKVHSNASLELTTKLPLSTAPDNLFVDDEGSLWVGSHPVMWQALTHMLDSRRYSAPSQVLTVYYDAEKLEFGSVTEVYADDGVKLQAATVAVRNRDQILIGTYSHKLMLCTLHSMGA